MSTRAERRRALRDAKKKVKPTHRLVNVTVIDENGEAKTSKRLAPMDDIKEIERNESIKHNVRAKVFSVTVDNRKNHGEENE